MEEDKAKTVSETTQAQLFPESKICSYCCGDSALFRCGKCSQAQYCSKKCQVEDWKKSHKKNCFPLKVQLMEDGRRHVFATKSFEAGDIVWKEVPIVSGPVDMKVYQHKYKKFTAVNPELCICCCTEVWPSEGVRCQCGLKTCGSPKCLKNEMHQSTECSILKNIVQLQIESEESVISQYMSPTEIAYFLRVLKLKDDQKSWEKFLELNDYPQPISLEKFQDLKLDGKMVPEALDDLFENGEISRREYRYNARYREFCRLLIDTGNVPDLTEADISEIMGKMYWNSIDDESSIPMDHYTHKKWICYMGSTADHSCTPNVMWKIYDKDREVVFRAMQPIKAGDEILIWRNMVLENTGYYTISRRAYLLDYQDFECFCSRCRDPTENGSYNSAMKCLNGNCTGAMLKENPLSNESPFKCDTCDCSATAEYFDKVLKQTTFLQKALNDLLEPYLTKNRDCKEWMKAISDAEKIIAFGIRKWFHPKNAWVKLGKRDICTVFYTQIEGQAKSDEPKLIKKLIVTYARDVIKYCKQMLEDPSDYSVLGFTRWRGFILTVYYATLSFLKINGTKDKISEFSQDLEKLDQIAKEAKLVLEFFADEPVPAEYLKEIERLQNYFKSKK